MNLRQQVGQLVLAGLEGPALTSVERAWLKLIQPTGIILFRRNIEEPAQIISLLREAAALTEAPQFRAIDLEGGLVDRLRDLIAPMPSPAAVFATGKHTNYLKHGRLIAQEVRALGFNTTFAPVLDLSLPISAEVMRTRVVSPDPPGVIAYAEAFLDGLAREKVLGCGKHFPGLGGGTLDSHHAMPVIERSWNNLWDNDLAIYRKLAKQLSLVMVAHASYPQTKDKRPASTSPFWITEILRKKIGFKGLIISDDMEMGGILTQSSIEDAAVEAIAAGTDIVEICKDPALILRAYEALLTQAEKSSAFRKRVEESSRRVLAFKRRHFTATVPPAPSAKTITRLRTAAGKFAHEVAG